MTIPEFNLLVETEKLRNVDRDYRQHLQAFLNFQAKARRKNGRPVYRRFKQFFNYKRAEENALKKPEMNQTLKRYAEYLDKKKGGGVNG